MKSPHQMSRPLATHGRREIEAARRRLSAAKKQASSASEVLRHARAMMEAAERNMDAARSGVTEAEGLLREAEERWEVIDVESDEGEDEKVGSKRRRVTMSPVQGGKRYARCHKAADFTDLVLSQPFLESKVHGSHHADNASADNKGHDADGDGDATLLEILDSFIIGID